MNPISPSPIANIRNDVRINGAKQFDQHSTPILSSATMNVIEASKPNVQHGPMPDFGSNASGLWPSHFTSRNDLQERLLLNLRLLTQCEKSTPKAKSLSRELTQVWNCLSEAEQVNRLQHIAPLVSKNRLGTPDAPGKGAAMRWLRLTLKTTPTSERNRLLGFLPEDQANIIKKAVFNKPNATMVDTLFDYKAFLKANERIGTIPADCRGKLVAIIGSGLGGTTAAYELLKIGLHPVIIEASDRVGGRFESRHFKEPDGTKSPEFAELGGMRFPPSGAAFFHYLKTFEIEMDPNFPNPGKVPTTLYFKGEVIDWPAGQDEPNHPVLQQVARDFKQFITTLVTPMEEARAANDVDGMQRLWQGYIEKYKDTTFLSGLTGGLKDLGIVWSKDQKDAFGALGIGTGGFGPLYKAGFLEVLRIILNKLEVDQHLVTQGTATVIDKFYNTVVEQPDGTRVSLRKDADIRLGTKVNGISVADGKHKVSMTDANGETRTEQFDAVIVATTPAAMKQMGLSMHSTAEKPLLDNAVADALTDLHMVSSSKVFFRTPTKFWKDNPEIPQVVLTDQTQHMLYCLDYPGTDHGVVLGSYTWEDKSIEWSGMPGPQRVEQIFRALKKMQSPIAAAMERAFGSSLERMQPGDIHCIDWHNETNYYGAFKFNSPGQEENVQPIYYAFQKGKDGTGVFLAGDSVSYNGGWAHGASVTGLHAALGALEYVGGKAAKGSPMTELNPNLYRYS